MPLNNPPVVMTPRQQFLAELLTLLGDTRALFLPKPSDTTTSTDESLTGRVYTHDATIAARLASLGLGYYTTFNGSDDYASTPDTANLEFGNGSVDQAFSVVALVNVTNTANYRGIASKYVGGSGYAFYVDNADKLTFQIGDASAAKFPLRVSDAAITQGSWHLMAGTYSAATGGATAMNDVTLYQDAIAVASTAANEALYVAMEADAGLGYIGIRSGTADIPFQGSIALVAICQTNLLASDHWAIKKLVNAYFGLAL